MFPAGYYSSVNVTKISIHIAVIHLRNRPGLVKGHQQIFPYSKIATIAYETHTNII